MSDYCHVFCADGKSKPVYTWVVGIDLSLTDRICNLCNRDLHLDSFAFSWKWIFMSFPFWNRKPGETWQVLIYHITAVAS